MSRLVKSYGDLRKGVLSERNSSGQMEHFRHFQQEMTPAIEHTKHTAQKVNDAPKAGNQNGWAYIGSVPITILVDWINDNCQHWPAANKFHLFAIDHEGAKTRFRDWFLKNRDLNKFHANTYANRKV